jgi:probable rRNA maturation factor
VEIITNNSVTTDGLNERLLTEWLSGVVRNEGGVLGEITIVFMSDNELIEYNNQYLNHNCYTDIITFDYTGSGVVSGDLLISIDRVRDNASSLSQSFINELHRVCVHGVLHLLGYKDKTPEDQKDMRAKEDFYLNKYVSRET